MNDNCDLLVLGGGPGGYTAAFRAADLGLTVALVDENTVLGGVCLNVGCIPSKTLLHMAQVLEEARALGAHGITTGAPEFDWPRIRARKNAVIGALTKGLAQLARARRVKVIQGRGRFSAANEITITGEEGAEQRVQFKQAVIATGSRPVALPAFPRDARVWNSTDALEVSGPPGSLLVIGGGIIGLEMATVYLAFGWKVTIVELLPRLLAGVDADLVRPLELRLRKRCEAIHTGVGVAEISAETDSLRVTFAGEKPPAAADFDRVLVSVGRRANTENIGLDALGINCDAGGEITVDSQQRTSAAHVFAIGDVTPGPQLAHRAAHQGRVAAEVAAGMKRAFDARTVPSVAYTDPEIAWAGVTEGEAKERGIAVKKAVFPWGASGRALSVGRGEGLTKLLFAEENGRLLGAGICGAHAGELIAEATLGIELGADAKDLGLTVHAHPTLSESIAFAAEVAEGTATDLPPQRP